jgi:hypothetical protein
MRARQRDSPTSGRRLRGRKSPPASQAKSPAARGQPPAPQGNGAGIIRPDTGALKLPSGFGELGQQESSGDSARIVLVIAVLAITFIIIIAYFVSQMPPKG